LAFIELQACIMLYTPDKSVRRCIITHSNYCNTIMKLFKLPNTLRILITESALFTSFDTVFKMYLVITIYI
jgi:hypothetical protein